MFSLQAHQNIFSPEWEENLKGKLSMYKEDQNTHVQVHMGLSYVLLVLHFFSPSIFSLFPLYYLLFFFFFFFI